MTPIRWRTFSLRTLLILITGIAVWLGYYVNSANKQRRAVEMIGKDGHVVYYHEFPFPYGSTGTVNYKAEPHGPRWLRQIVGDDYFRTVRRVFFAPDESSLAQLRNLPEVDCIAICAIRLKDDDLQHVSGLGNLRVLSIFRGGSLSDAFLEHIKSIPNLSDLAITETPITDECVEYLKNMTQLKFLILSDTLVSKDAAAKLQASLPQTTIDVIGTYDPATQTSSTFIPTNDTVTKSRRANGSD